MWLALANLGAIDEAQAFDAVGATILHQGCQGHRFGRRGRDDDFPDIPVRHPMSRAEFVGKLVAAHAVPRLERSRLVVDSGVNHPAVARTSAHSKLWQCLEQKNVAPVFGERASNRAAHNASADDYDICLIHDRYRCY